MIWRTIKHLTTSTLRCYYYCLYLAQHPLAQIYLWKYSHIWRFSITIYICISGKLWFFKKEVFYLIPITHFWMRAQNMPFIFQETLKEIEWNTHANVVTSRGWRGENLMQGKFDCYFSCIYYVFIFILIGLNGFPLFRFRISFTCI